MSSCFVVKGFMGCILIYICIGIMYTYGNVSDYISAYLVSKYDDNKYYGSLNWIFMVQIIMEWIGMIAGYKISNKYNEKVTILFGGIMYSFGIICTHYSYDEYFEFMVSYGILTGFSIGMCVFMDRNNICV